MDDLGLAAWGGRRSLCSWEALLTSTRLPVCTEGQAQALSHPTPTTKGFHGFPCSSWLHRVVQPGSPWHLSAAPGRDVSTVEVLMNYHQGLKSEIETHNKDIAACVDLGKTLVLNKSPASEEVRRELSAPALPCPPACLGREIPR